MLFLPAPGRPEAISFSTSPSVAASIHDPFNKFSHPGGTEAIADLLDDPQVPEADGLVHRKFRGRLADRFDLIRLSTGFAFLAALLDQLALVNGDDGVAISMARWVLVKTGIAAGLALTPSCA